MSDTTNISWTDATWNPWRGCTAVSPGCAHCYARALVNGRMGGDFSKRVRAAAHTFNAPLRWSKRAFVCDVCGKAMPKMGAPGTKYYNCWHDDKASYHRRRVFFGSLMDWLDDVPIEWLADALDIVRRCPDLIFQCVTKRPELWRPRLEKLWKAICDESESEFFEADGDAEFVQWILAWLGGSPPPNVWIIASVENQPMADERIPQLLKIPAAVRGLSVEPLLEPVNLRLAQGVNRSIESKQFGPWIHWIIVGGESGPKRRDCGVDAIVDVARQCQAAGAPCFVKQDCASKPGQQGRIPDELWSFKQFPNG